MKGYTVLTAGHFIEPGADDAGGYHIALPDSMGGGVKAFPSSRAADDWACEHPHPDAAPGWFGEQSWKEAVRKAREQQGLA